MCCCTPSVKGALLLNGAAVKQMHARALRKCNMVSIHLTAWVYLMHRHRSSVGCITRVPRW